MVRNAPWRDALVVLAVVALFVVGTLVGRQFLGGDDSANGNTSDESQGDFGTRAARFDDLKFTGTYLLTPFDRPTDPVVIPARDRTPGAAITPTPEPTPAGPPITVIWYHDGNKHNRFTFHGPGPSEDFDVFEDGEDVVLCSTRASDIAAMEATSGLCYEGGFTGGEGAEYDRGDLAVLSTVQVAGETAYCHGTADQPGNCYADDGVLLSGSGSSSTGIDLGLRGKFKSQRLDFFSDAAHDRYELRAEDVVRGVDEATFKPPFEVQQFPGFGAPDCPTSAETDTSAQFSESCVRSIVRFPFAWPHLLDDYQDPFIEFTSSDSFDAGYYSRLPRVHARLQLSVSQHDPRPDPSFYERESAETINGVAVTFRDQSVRADSDTGPVPREAAWTDGIADYVLTAYPGSNESTDDALHRVVSLILKPPP